MIRLLCLLFFFSWGTITSAQIDSIQKDRSAYRQAENFFQNGQKQEATQAFIALTKSNNTKEAAHFRLATIYSENANLDLAIFHIDKALQFCKNCDDYILQKAQILSNLGKYNEAGEQYIEAIKLNPSFWTRYNKAIFAFKSANNTQKAIEVTRLWEKQFQLKPEIGIRYIQEFSQLGLKDSVLLYAKKLLLKYPKNPEIFKKTQDIYKSNQKYLEFSEILKLRYLTDTNNIDFQLDILPNELLIQMEQICKNNQILTTQECKNYGPREYYKNNQSLVRKIAFNKNLSTEQKKWAHEVFFWSESNLNLLDSCYKLSFSHHQGNPQLGYSPYCFLVACNLYNIGKYTEAQKYFLSVFFNDPNLSSEKINKTLHCCALNGDKSALEKCKNYLEEIMPFMANSDLFDALFALSDKQYQSVIQIISSISNLSNNPNKSLYYNILAYCQFKIGEIKSAILTFDNLKPEQVLDPCVILAFQCYKQSQNIEKAHQFLNMAYFLGTIDEEGKKLYLNQMPKTK